MHVLPRRLAPRLILALTVLVAVSRGIFGYLDTHERERLVVDEMITGADELSRSITSATWHAMLADRRDAAYQIMDALGAEHGVESIRIFNKKGRVTFSTDPDAPGEVGVDDQACAICHAQAQALVEVPVTGRTRIFSKPDGSRALAMVTPIYNEPACTQAECHAHEATTPILGVLDVRLDLRHADARMAQLERRAWLINVAEILVIGLFIALFTRHFVGVPIRRLKEGTQDVGEMELGREVKIETPTELAELADAYNTTRLRLKEALDDLHELTQNLEHQVEERSRQLAVTQQKLIQSDRLASLGQLAASVAHEINNPVSGVLNFSMVLQRMIEKDGIPPDKLEDFRRYLRMITDETTRVGRIVADLLAFSRRASPQTGAADLNEIVQRTIPLVAHKLELSGVTPEVELTPGLPAIAGDAAQLQQVVINLVMNAAESMPDGGKVTILTRPARFDDRVVMEVSDEGAGIAPEHIGRIFDPFFSTKDEGKGVGLGLSVVYGIIDAHQGTIDVSSRLGKGSTFIVRLPPLGVTAGAGTGSGGAAGAGYGGTAGAGGPGSGPATAGGRAGAKAKP
jgi:two-component system NtrC family sensor kinase